MATLWFDKIFLSNYIQNKMIVDFEIKQKCSIFIFILQETEMEMPQEIQQYEMSDLRMNKMVRPQVLLLVLQPLLVEVQVRKLK